MNFKSIRPGKIAGAPLVNDLKSLKYSNDGVLFKLRHSEKDWQALPVRLNMKTIAATSNLPKLYKNRRKIKVYKHGHLQQLKSSMINWFLVGWFNWF